MKKIFLLLTCLMIGFGMTFSQTPQQVNGTVVDENGEPVIGASILTKENTTISSVTDINGKFTLETPVFAQTLVVKYLGMQTQEVAVAQTVFVTLHPAYTGLDEVIVVAYGTSKKSSITGSATQVSGEELTKKNQTEISKVLAGEVAGLQVFNTSGQPGTAATIRIRGFGSANSSRDPLFVLDGAPYDGDISAINPADIESATVLKDASASALYGARAANGVILITTKKGNKEKSIIEIDVKRGVNMRLLPFFETIDSPEIFSELGWEALRNFGTLANGLSKEDAGVFASENIFNSARGIAPSYNMWNCAPNEVIDPITGKFSGATRKYMPEKWADYLFQNGDKTEANLRFSGGSDKISYYTSFGFLDEEGYYIGSDYSRLNARTNLNYQPREWLKITTNLAYTRTEANKALQDNSYNGFRLVNYVLPLSPVFKHDTDGNLIPDIVGGYQYDYGEERKYLMNFNPVGMMNLETDRQTGHNIQGNLNFDVFLPLNLKFSAQNSYQYHSRVDKLLKNPYYGSAQGVGRVTRTNIEQYALSNMQMLSRNSRFGVHSVSAFAAHESYSFVYHTDSGEKYMLARGDNVEFSNAVMMQSLEGYQVKRAMESYFAQVKYGYDEKYFADLNFRRDGSSRFKNHKWGNFGSVGAAWVVSKENFMYKNTIINDLQLKASYGVYGNENLALGNMDASFYPTENFYAIKNLNGAITYMLTNLGNPDLTWENSRMFNIAVDFGLLKNRLLGNVELFQKRTDNMIFSKQVASSLGVASVLVNDAELENKGIEFNLKGKLIQTKDWELTLQVNGTHYRNTMLKMPKYDMDEQVLDIHTLPDFIVLGSGFGWSHGHSIYDYYMRDYAGVNFETGQSQWYVYYDDNNINALGDATSITNMTDYLSSRKSAGKEVILRKGKTMQYNSATIYYIGKSAIPDLTGALQWSVRYKVIELNLQFIYGIGGYGYDRIYETLMGNYAVGTYNWHKDILNRWTEPLQQTDVPRLSANYDVESNYPSSRFLTNRSYLGLNNIRISFRVPQKWMGRLGAKNFSPLLWLSGDNLFVLSARKGYYPLGAEGGNNVDDQFIPSSTVMAGINFKF
jgi:TonB-linked SusC/RagA family outer membrane protein